MTPDSRDDTGTVLAMNPAWPSSSNERPTPRWLWPVAIAGLAGMVVAVWVTGWSPVITFP